MRFNGVFGISVASLIFCAVPARASGEINLNGGVWSPVAVPHELTTVTGEKPPLRPGAAKSALPGQAKPLGNKDVERARQCLPPGVPRILLKGAPFEFLQRSDQIVILYEWNRMIRTVDMNVPQPEVIGPAYLGQSVGRWVGSTLRIETIGFNDSTSLDESGLPHSDQLRVIEEYSVRSSDEIDLLVTIEDPKTFTKPWQTRLQFKRDATARIKEDVCLERIPS